MKKFRLIALAVVMTATVSLSAQNKGSGKQQFSAEGMATRQTEVLKKKVDLTADQETKVQAIYLKYAQQREEAMKTQQAAAVQTENSSQEKSKRGGKGLGMDNESMEKMNEEIKAVLTAEQQEKFESARKKQTSMDVKRKSNKKSKS